MLLQSCPDANDPANGLQYDRDAHAYVLEDNEKLFQ